MKPTLRRAMAWLVASLSVLAIGLARPAARQSAAVKPAADAQFDNVMYQTPDSATWKRATENGRLVFAAPAPPPDFVTLTVFPGARLAGDFRQAFDAAVSQELKRLGVMTIERDGGDQPGTASEGYPVLQRVLVGVTSEFHTYHWFLAGNPGDRLDMIAFQTSAEGMYNYYNSEATNFFLSVKLANSLQAGFRAGATPATVSATPARPAAPAGAAPSAVAARPPQPAPAATASAPTAAPPSVQPAASRVTGGAVTGVFFMTRYWSFNQTLEKAAWYFAPDGRVFENLQYGFSSADMAADGGPKGTFRVEGGDLVVAWSDGKSTRSKLELDGGGFAWDGGLFVPVTPFQNAAAAAGTYQGGESLSHGGNTVAVSKDLTLRPDGTFTWEGIGFVQGTTDRSNLVGGAQSATTGRWRLDGYSIILTDTAGKVLRGIAFPYEVDASTRPWMFFAGMMYKPR